MKNPQKALSGFGYSVVAALIIVALVGVAYFKSADATRWVVHTLEVKNSLEQLVGALRDAETGQRGYLLTGAPSYLEPYHNGRAAYEENRAELALLIAADPRQRDTLARIEALATQKLAELARTLELVQGGDREAALAVVGDNSGKQYMDQIRALATGMSEAEDRLLAERRRAYAWWRDVVTALLITALLLAMGSLYQLYRRVQPVFVELSEAQESLQKANNNISESLAQLKKVMNEKATEIQQRERVEAHNAALTKTVVAKQARLYEITTVAANELYHNAHELAAELDALYPEEKEGAPNARAVRLARALITGVARIKE